MPFKTGGSTTDKGKYWTPEHRKYRASLVDQMKREGFLLCTAKVCVFRSRRITNPKGRERDGLHAGHKDNGVDYAGPQHNACNIKDGAVRGRAKQNRKSTQLKWLQGEAAPRPWFVQDNHPCPICSAPVAWQTQRCCSRACANEFIRRSKPAPLIYLRSCPTCSAVFVPRRGRRYCRPTCRPTGLTCCICTRPIIKSPSARPQGEAICHQCRPIQRQRHRRKTGDRNS